MTDPFLCIEIFRDGIRATRVSEASSPSETVLFEGLSADTETVESVLVRGVKAAAGALDLNGIRKAAVLISPGEFSFRPVTLPFANKKKLHQVLPFELAAGLPDPELAFDFDFILLDRALVEGEHTVLCACLPSQTLDDITGALSGLDLPPRLITAKGYAEAAAYLLSGTEPACIFVHLDRDDTCTAVLAADGQPQQIRSFRIHGDPAREIVRIVQQMRIRFEHQAGESGPFSLVFAPGEITPRSRQLHEELTAIAENCTDTLSVAAAPWTPPDEFPEPLFSLPQDKLLNFGNAGRGSGTYLRAYKPEIILAAALGAAFLLLLFLGLRLDITSLENRLDRGKEAMAAIYRETFPEKAAANVPAPFLMMQAELARITKTARDSRNDEADFRPAIQVTQLLSELSQKIPAAMDVELDRLVASPGQLILAGSTDTFNTVDRLKSLMETIVLFRKVDIASAEAGKKDNRIMFKFLIDL